MTGVGEALIFVGAATIVTDLAPESRRGEAISIYSLGLWVGLAVGPFLGELVLGDDRFDAVWLPAAACALAAAFFGLALPETRPAHDGPHDAKLLHRTRCAPASCSSPPSSASPASAPSSPSTRGSSGWTERPPPSSSSPSSSSRSASSAADPRPPRPETRVGTALALLAIGLTTIGVWNEPAGLYAGTVVFAAGQALAFPALLTLAVAGTRRRSGARRSARFTACADLGFAIGALTLGGVAALAGYEGVFLAAALASVAGAFLLPRIPRPAPARPAEASDRPMEQRESGGAGSPSRRSSSAAGASAASARRRRSSGRGSRGTRRSGSWTPPGSSASRRSTPPMPTAAAGARRGSASGSLRRARRSGRDRARDEDVQPAARGRRPWPRAATRILRQIDGSLARLGVERIALYLAHASIRTSRRRRRCARSTSSCALARSAPRARRTSPPSSSPRRWSSPSSRARAVRVVQNSFSLLDREDAETVLPVCREHGLAYEAFGPLAGGWLTGKYRRGEPYPEGSRMTHGPSATSRTRTTRVFDALEAFEREALGRGVSMPGLALAWLVRAPEITAVVVGPTPRSSSSPCAMRSRSTSRRRTASICEACSNDFSSSRSTTSGRCSTWRHASRRWRRC